MISVPVVTGDIPCGYDICYADDICLRHMKERILYHTCEASISYGNAVYHIAVSDISLKNEQSCSMIQLDKLEFDEVPYDNRKTNEIFVLSNW